MKKLFILIAFMMAGLSTFASNTDPVKAVLQTGEPEPNNACIVCVDCQGVLLCGLAGTCGDAVDIAYELSVGMGCAEDDDVETKKD